MKRLQTKVLLEAQNSFTDKYNKAIFSRQLFLFRTRTEEHYLTLFGAISILLRYFWVNLVSALIYKLKLFTVFATHWSSYWGAKSEDELPSVRLFFAHSPGQRASHGLTESWKVLGWRGPERSFHSNPLATGRDATPLARSLRAPSSLAWSHGATWSKMLLPDLGCPSLLHKIQPIFQPGNSVHRELLPAKADFKVIVKPLAKVGKRVSVR